MPSGNSQALSPDPGFFPELRLKSFNKTLMTNRKPCVSIALEATCKCQKNQPRVQKPFTVVP